MLVQDKRERETRKEREREKEIESVLELRLRALSLELYLIQWRIFGRPGYYLCGVISNITSDYILISSSLSISLLAD